MAVEEVAYGSITADGTEQALVTNESTQGVYTLMIDLSNMEIGDEVVLRIEAKTLSLGSYAVVFEKTFAHEQAEPVKISEPILILYGFQCSIQQTAGTYRDFDWHVGRV